MSTLSYEQRGFNLEMAAAGFSASNNPHKTEFAQMIQQAKQDAKMKEALLTAIAESWGVNGDKTFDILSDEYVRVLYSQK